MGATSYKIYRLPCLTLLLLALVATACGGAGEADKPTCLLCGTFNDLRGAVSNKSGSQAQMQGWVVAAVEMNTGIARVAEVDSAGLYTLSHLNTDAPQTLALLSPDYILQAVLSIPANDPKTIHQFVYFHSPQVPKLIYDGTIVTFENLGGLQVNKKLAAAQKGNGIPDGSVQITGQAAALTGFGLASVPDTNQDGIPNDKDPDIDGDGIVNWLDQDENGNSVIDVFDPDANSDLINDLTPQGQNTVQFFSEGIEYLAPQFEIGPKSDNSGMTNSLKFVTKVRTDVTPIAVQVRGAPSLLNNATYVVKDSAGVITAQAWNRLLADDGQSEDGAAGDRVFGKRVTLADGKAPRANEVIFIELVFGTPAAPWYVDFPWVWPSIKPASITAQYDTNTRTILLIGNPFGTIQDFVWNASVFDSNQKVVFTSASTAGSVRQYIVPDNILVSGQTYQFQVTAQSLDKVPGIPAYAIHSIKYDMK